MFDALAEFELLDYSAVTLYVHPALRSRIRNCNLIDMGPNGEELLQSIKIVQDPMMLQTKGVYTSRFEIAGKTIGLLTTREH
jgi:hypothetical protein